MSQRIYNINNLSRQNKLVNSQCYRVDVRKIPGECRKLMVIRRVHIASEYVMEENETGCKSLPVMGNTIFCK